MVRISLKIRAVASGEGHALIYTEIGNVVHWVGRFTLEQAHSKGVEIEPASAAGPALIEERALSEQPAPQGVA
jgi:hypothetical protein